MGQITRLLVLWLLAEQPLHGYRIRRALRDAAFGFWFRIEDASIYAMLRSLSAQGFATCLGEAPGDVRARTLYRITPAGRRALADGLRAAWCHVDRPTEPISAALAMTDEFEASEIRQLLTARRQAVAARRQRLDDIAPGAPSPRLVRRETALLEAELTWLENELADMTRPKRGDRR